MRPARHSVLVAMLALTACSGVVRSGLVPEADLARTRRVHVSGGCATEVADALRSEFARRGVAVTVGSPGEMPPDTDLRVECSSPFTEVPSIWSSSGTVSYVSWLFLVFLDPRDDAVMATAEYSGFPHEADDVQKPIAALLDSLYATAPSAEAR